MAEKTVPATQNNETQIVKREVTRHPEAFVTPLTDIYEEENGLHVVVDLPGVEKSGLKLSVENDILTIEGHVNADKKDTSYLIREFENRRTTSDSSNSAKASTAKRSKPS